MFIRSSRVRVQPFFGRRPGISPETTIVECEHVIAKVPEPTQLILDPPHVRRRTSGRTEKDPITIGVRVVGQQDALQSQSAVRYERARMKQIGIKWRRVVAACASHEDKAWLGRPQKEDG